MSKCERHTSEGNKRKTRVWTVKIPISVQNEPTVFYNEEKLNLIVHIISPLKCSFVMKHLRELLTLYR